MIEWGAYDCAMMRCALVLCGCVSLLTACGKKVPREVRPTLDAIRDDARKVADAAAKLCGAQFVSGQFFVSGTSCGQTVLPGQTTVPVIASPAKGTALETNPNVIEVETTCEVGMSSQLSCGLGLATLRNAFKPGAFQSGNWDTAEDSCKDSASNCEMVEVPSRMVKETKSVDLTIVRPMLGGPGGGRARVKVTIAIP